MRGNLETDLGRRYPLQPDFQDLRYFVKDGVGYLKPSFDKTRFFAVEFLEKETIEAIRRAESGMHSIQ